MHRRTYIEFIASGLGGSAVGTTTYPNSLRRADEISQTKTEASGEINWDFSTDSLFTASPTVVSEAVIIGDVDGTLYSIDTQDGTPNWQTKLDSGIGHAANVTIGDAAVDIFETDITNIAYVGTAAASVYAIDTRTGSVVWKSEFNAQQATSPIAIEDLVITMLGNNPSGGGPGLTVRQSGNTGSLIRLGASTITLNIAHYFSGGNLKDLPPGRYEAEDRYVLCGTINNAQPFFLDAVSYETGETIWSVELEDTVYGTPTLLNDAWYFATADGGLYSVDAKSGERRWKTSGFNGFFTSPTAYKNTVYFVDRGSGQTGSSVYAVEPKIGAFRWRTVLDGQVRGSAPTVVDDSVYLCDQSGKLYQLNIHTGDITQQQQLTESRISSAPTVVNGTLYVGGEDGTLYAVNIPSEGASAGTRVERGSSGHHFYWAGTVDPAQSWKLTQVVGTQRRGSTPQYGNAIELVDNDEILIGDPGRNAEIDGDFISNVGGVEVLEKTDAEWNLTQQLSLDTVESQIRGFGRDIAVDGESAVIGTNGGAYVYSRLDDGWSLQGELTPNQETTDLGYGSFVVFTDETAVVVAPRDSDGRGAAYVFTNEEGSWTQTQRITPPTEQSELGMVDSTNGRLFFLGYQKSNVYIYDKSDDDWILRMSISTGLERPTSLIVGDGVLIISDSSNQIVKIFEGERFDWEQTSQLAPEIPPGSGFGSGIATSSGELLIGAPKQESYTQSPGIVHRAERQDGEWTITDQIHRLSPSEMGVELNGYLGIGKTVEASSKQAFIGTSEQRGVGIYEPSGRHSNSVIDEVEVDVTRSVSASEVAPGEEVTVTTEITRASGSVSTRASYDPQVASATIQSVTVNGASTNPTISQATVTGSTVTVGDVGTDATVTITEKLTVASSSATGIAHEITGEVTVGGSETTEVDPVSVTVTVAEPQSVVDEYDTDNDGTISITELGAAGADFASGELTITELGRLGAAFASGE
jgi:outer membrane protein assembly factor BamB